MKKLPTTLKLPCLRGLIGDWFFYISVMNFKEIATRVKLPDEIDKKYKDEKLKLGEWIQRKIESKRIVPLVNYIHKQEQRFFNSLVLGIFDGEPTWQDFNIKKSNFYDELDESSLDYFSKTFGILTLSGKESIFAIDGQHRAIGIRNAIKESKANPKDEVAVIFVAHTEGEKGKIRTRRLFSTLNRYAKPVSESEKIALSEDDNCAIITRKIIDEQKYLKNKVLLNKTRSINPGQVDYFTSIMVLYDIVTTLLVEKNIPGLGEIGGQNKDSFLHIRVNDEEIERLYIYIDDTLNTVIKKIPALRSFFIHQKKIDRNDLSENLLFRPIGQNIFFDILKVGLEYGKSDEVIELFANLDFSLKNKIFKQIFWDSETDTIKTDKSRQRFTTLLLLDKLGYDIVRTPTDKSRLKNFRISLKDI